MERMSCFRFIYDEWYGEDVLFYFIHILDSYESGMERMSCFRFI